MTALIEVFGLFKSYGAISVLKDISFSMIEGQSLAIIGPNGAGKTTLFKVVTGEVFATRGGVRHLGHEVGREPAFRRVRRGIGRTFQVARIFPAFSALENLVVAVESRHRNHREAYCAWYAVRPSRAVHAEALGWLAEVGLADAAAFEAKSLSHGDKKRLELAIALALEPRILMLDEPTAGMSPPDRHDTVALLARIKRERGITLMMTEHDMDVVFGLTDRLMVMNYGAIIAEGTPAEVRDNPVVRQVYLGEDMLDA